MMTRTLLLLATSALAVGACKKTDKAPPKAEPVVTVTTDASPAVDPAAENLKKIAAAFEKLDATVAKEKERWTPELEAKAVALRDGNWKTTDEALTAILASDHRFPGNAARDQYRHPRETLGFFGLEPTMHVVELGAGAGWYTELLAPLLAKNGSLTAVGPDPDGPADQMTAVYGKRLVKLLEKSPGLFGAVKRVAITPPAQLTLGDPGSADMVIAFRELHNWVEDNNHAAYLQAIHAVLKDGGTFAVVDHRAAADAKLEDAVKLGYLPEPWVVQTVTAAGFELAAKSDINANPKDTKDYKDGVWTLPPALTLGDVDREKYLAIGESDRMSLKFVKRAAK